MKKNIYILLALLLLVFTTGSVLAKNEKSPNPNKPTYVGKQIKNVIRKTEELQVEVNSTNNEEVETEVDEIIDEQIEVDTEIDTSLNNMKARPSLVKFIMGPDYKNAGQVRSQIVQLRNQISKLYRLKDKVTDATGTTIDETIESLNADLYSIELKLSQELKGFSLLGWLSKLLTNFEVVVTPTVTPSTSPSVEPSPIATPEESPTSVPTVVPTP